MKLHKMDNVSLAKERKKQSITHVSASLKGMELAMKVVLPVIFLSVPKISLNVYQFKMPNKTLPFVLMLLLINWTISQMDLFCFISFSVNCFQRRVPTLLSLFSQ